MKRISVLFVAAWVSVTLIACSGSDDANAGQGKAAAEKTAPAGQQGSGQANADIGDFSYALGMNIANSLSQIKSDVDPDQLAQGLKDALAGKETRLTDQKAQQILQAKAQQIQAEQLAERDKQADKNLKASNEFLAKHKQEEGVKVTDSGLQYKVLRKGDGPQPTADDTVVVDYKGTLPDGTVFDSTYARGKPATFPVNAVIPGWTEALQMMHVGSKYELVIPPKLAYGEQGAGQRIGPNEALVFEVELKGVKKKSGAQQQSGQAEPQQGGNGAATAQKQGTGGAK